MPGVHRLRELSRAIKRRQIGLMEDRFAVPLAAYLIDERLGPLLVAAMDRDFRPGGGKFGADIAPDAIGRTGD